MSASKHTPGPWWAEGDPGGGWHLACAHDCRVIQPDSTGEVLFASEADMHLIAAAPALLDALQLFVTAVSTNGAFHALSHELEVGRAALDVARGEEA